jgi:L-rhamnose mutarotase
MGAAERDDPHLREWEALMWNFQKPTPWTPAGMKWTPMSSIFRLQATDDP